MKNIVIGFLGTRLDAGKKRRWRPTVSLVETTEFAVDRLELLYDARFLRLAKTVQRDIEEISPKTEVVLIELNLDNPWDFQEVYGKLFDFARSYGFDDDREQYHVHLTTGTHVAQICWFLLTESRHVPARLIQTAPPAADKDTSRLDIIDLDLSRYNALQQRFDQMSREYSDHLKGGIDTKSHNYNELIDRIELVAGSSNEPILLLGETGTGKSELAQRIYELKLDRRRIKGRLVTVNCATLQGQDALAILFGQRRSYLNQAGSERSGLLREADGGVLFLDEVDELGLKEQAVLLNAVETGRFYPLGSDHEISSRFQIIAGSNRDLRSMTADGEFRPDLLARLNMWAFTLPPLRDRPKDIEVNITHELSKSEKDLGVRVGFNSDAFERFVDFAKQPNTLWPGNYRDFSGSIKRLCTLAPRGRITRAMVDDEIALLRNDWASASRDNDTALLVGLLGARFHNIDPFDAVQLAQVVRICRQMPNISTASRALFAYSRTQRTTVNDADRLKKYLKRYDLNWSDVVA